MHKEAEEWRAKQARCKQCNHLMSMHKEDGCGCWNLGVRAVMLYRCACVVSMSKTPQNYPQAVNDNSEKNLQFSNENNSAPELPDNKEHDAKANELQQRIHNFANYAKKQSLTQLFSNLYNYEPEVKKELEPHQKAQLVEEFVKLLHLVNSIDIFNFKTIPMTEGNFQNLLDISEELRDALQHIKDNGEENAG